MALELRSTCCGSTVTVKTGNVLRCDCCDHDCQAYGMRVD